MAFVDLHPGPTELAEWLSREFPYCEMRHIIRSGIVWRAQVRYQSGASLGRGREKRKYDLYFIEATSQGLNLLTSSESVKTDILGRGSRQWKP